MYTLSDKFQFQAMEVKDGKHQLPMAHQEVLNWISNQFGVNALDFSCETRATSKGAHQQVVHLILETGEQVQRMQGDRAVTASIVKRFLNYFTSAVPDGKASDSLKTDVLPFGSQPFPEIIVTYRPLKELTSKVLREMLEEEKRTILGTFESVWTLSVSVVFYYTDAQVKENYENGISDKISEALVRATNKYGLTGDSSYRFDSKETFDRDYSGNWHYYWQ